MTEGYASQVWLHMIGALERKFIFDPEQREVLQAALVDAIGSIPLPSRSKKARSGYNMYVSHRCQEIKADKSIPHQPDRVRLIAQEWGNMGAEERREWDQKAQAYNKKAIGEA